MQNWIEKIHPVRAALALIAIIATIELMVRGILIPDGWWIIVTALALVYAEAVRKPSA